MSRFWNFNKTPRIPKTFLPTQIVKEINAGTINCRVKRPQTFHVSRDSGKEQSAELPQSPHLRGRDWHPREWVGRPSWEPASLYRKNIL